MEFLEVRASEINRNISCKYTINNKINWVFFKPVDVEYLLK